MLPFLPSSALPLKGLFRPSGRTDEGRSWEYGRRGGETKE